LDVVAFRNWQGMGFFMKRLNCRDLGGPCEAEFAADTFEEIGKKSHEHAMEQMQNGDEAHLSAANSMKRNA
jgi:predicted small metal-binding protein